MSKRVVVGLSGGVDSSVAAYLLQQQGFEVVGIFMRNWHDESVTINNECPWIEDSNDAMLVAEQLGIPFHVLDLSKEYKRRIVDYIFAEYEAGRTPNPDVLCNREIKFDTFLQAARSLRADFVATGHYCRKEIFLDEQGTPVYRLLMGKDSHKDQSYFLCQLNQNQLSNALFPIGGLTKPEVRELARKIALPTAEKKDSQGLCFIGKVKLPVFLQQELKPKKGNVIEVPDSPELFAKQLVNNDFFDKSLHSLAAPFDFYPSMGKKIGEHSGAHFYTIGQRKGLGVGGKVEPLFIVHTDTTETIVYVGQGDNHPALYRPALFIRQSDMHWIRPDLELIVGDSARYSIRIRYRQVLTGCSLFAREEGVYIVFDQPQRGIAPGQFAAWYLGDELIGSGTIS
ncbi:MAG: tRNA 2-thiouridine(34) synthase MnmA [Crocinitomicaceae bacterium]|nr:tRNA 2-thiouridine(34) synthase MnmA [Crocinitomicaceae bacterium]